MQALFDSLTELQERADADPQARQLLIEIQVILDQPIKIRPAHYRNPPSVGIEIEWGIPRRGRRSIQEWRERADMLGITLNEDTPWSAARDAVKAMLWAQREVASQPIEEVTTQWPSRSTSR